MKRSNEMGDTALDMYVNSEHVDVSKELLIDIVNQIVNNAEVDGFDEMSSNDFAVAGFLKLLMDTSHDLGFHKLQHDLQKLYTHYDIWGSEF